MSRDIHYFPPTRANRDILSGLRPGPVQTFDKPEIVDGPDVVITDLKYIGSYNWTNHATPTMIVPGSPPIWRERPLPFTVPPDPNSVFIEADAHWLPMTPLYPLLRAVDIVAEETADPVDWRSVDLVTDRNCLRNLLRWCGGGGNKPRDFRIDMQLAGRRTVLFSRFVTKFTEGTSAIQPTYGFSFERESTMHASGCENSISHARIVKYNLSGMKLVVRFEVDACLASPRPRAESSAEVDDLASTMSNLRVSSSAHSAAHSGGVGINMQSPADEPRIIRAGTQVSDDAIIELTTRSVAARMKFRWPDSYPQLFFSQTPHHFLAHHNAGQVREIVKRHVGDPEMWAVEAKAQTGFKKLRQLLKKIQDLVLEAGQDGRLSLVYQKGSLALYERANQDSCLPAQMLERFD
ncbi:hypothetical protein WOLCODRAFT_117364 [Wolfiporia cocos MD-104 SS10]|uniref:Geranylgeranyl pyrophosphate synthetase n=1 Tax=Wolfiporia cocos (strain MD-104) TaxID=742152 RepID=A0A2H3JE19_WOLCO|nr:hypothetical protein WOLCODRAFT_117364 [Wolfiporia cocos MD-104 SS10]